MKNKKMSKGKKIAIGAGVAAVTVASAGAYYLLGPNKRAHQKKAKALMAKMKKGVKSEIQKGKKMATPLYKMAKKEIKKSVKKIKSKI